MRRRGWRFPNPGLCRFERTHGQAQVLSRFPSLSGERRKNWIATRPSGSRWRREVTSASWLAPDADRPWRTSGRALPSLERLRAPRLFPPRSGRQEAQFDHPALPAVDAAQRAQRLIQRQQIHPWFFSGQGSFLQRDVNRSRPTLLVQAGTSQVGEDLSHQSGADGEEMSAVLPGEFLEINHPQVDLVNESGGLENVPGWLSCHVAMGAPVQLPLNQEGQFLQRLRIAGSPGSYIVYYGVSII